MMWAHYHPSALWIKLHQGLLFVYDEKKCRISAGQYTEGAVILMGWTNIDKKQFFCGLSHLNIQCFLLTLTFNELWKSKQFWVEFNLNHLKMTKKRQNICHSGINMNERSWVDIRNVWKVVILLFTASSRKNHRTASTTIWHTLYLVSVFTCFYIGFEMYYLIPPPPH